jgi:hypothetical protein
MDSTDEARLQAWERALGLDPAGDDLPDAAALRLAPLADLLPPLAPGKDLFARISGQLGLDMPLAGFHVVRHDEGSWVEVASGVHTKLLWRSATAGRRVMLLRLQPGAVLVPHVHGGDEECMVLSGDMQVNGVEFGPGDFQVAVSGSRHPQVTSRNGCICLISMAA